MPLVVAVVLAAGASRRMGRNKLLLEWEGEPLVRRAVKAALATADAVIVVLGHEAERVRGALAGLECEAVVNPDHGRGMGTSLRAGIARAAEAGAEAAVVVLADMPRAGAQTIAAVIERYRATRPPLVLSAYGDVPAPPTLYARALFAELLAVPDDRGGREVADRHRREAEVVAWPAEALADVDTPADYEAVKDPGRRPGPA